MSSTLLFIIPGQNNPTSLLLFDASAKIFVDLRVALFSETTRFLDDDCPGVNDALKSNTESFYSQPHPNIGFAKSLISRFIRHMPKQMQAVNKLWTIPEHSFWKVDADDFCFLEWLLNSIQSNIKHSLDQKNSISLCDSHWPNFCEILWLHINFM